MSTTPDSTNSPESPHGVDHARERKLILIFVSVIAVCFVLAGILVFGALALDFTNTGETVVEPPDFLTESPPAVEAPARTSHP